MGNKMCKKKVDSSDASNIKSPSPFDKICARLHLKPKSWKSDSHLNAKQVNRYEINPKDKKNGSALSAQQKAKSSDWTEADLEVPDKDEAIQLKNPQLSFIFNDNSTPTPPPRKHKKSIREKIESVAKNGIQALQAKKSSSEDSKRQDCETRQPAEEEICVKKTIRYGCPGCDNGKCSQHRPHEKKDTPKSSQKRAEKEAKRKKNLSVVSLPNYNELKFSIANGDDSNLKHIDSSLSDSANSLPGESKKLTATPAGKLENYMTRCRSFGSLLNNKLRTTKEPADNESDDSFGGLEDWDLGILEHYNPKDASLPRPRKPPPLRGEGEVLGDVEKLIVAEEELESVPPVRPVRRSESLIKKINRESSEAAAKRREEVEDEILKNGREASKSVTPPPSPQSRVEDEVPLIPVLNRMSTQAEDGKVEHSSLMRILQEFSVKDAQKRNGDGVSTLDGPNERPIDVQTNRNLPNYGKQCSLNNNNKNTSMSNATANFINVEKGCVS